MEINPRVSRLSTLSSTCNPESPGIPPHVSICVLTYNRSAVLKTLLLQLRDLCYRPMEIIVVDNHSTDDTPSVLANEFPSFTHLRTHTNMGAAGRNVGLCYASGKVIITLDDDVIGLTDEHIRSIVQLFLSRPKLGAVNFKILHSDTDRLCNWVHHCTEEEYQSREFATYEITEGAVAFRKEALDQAGYYAECYFLSHEGPDLAFRIMQHGFDVIYSPNIVVKHRVANEARAPWRNYYYDTRNQIWLAARNFPPAYALRYLLRGLPSMMVYSIRDGFFLYWLQAIRDGLTGLRRSLRERQVLSDSTMETIRNIDARRPPLSYVLRRTVSRRRVNLTD